MTNTDPSNVRTEVEKMWAETEARAERRGVTEPTRSLAPNCPPWCTVTHRAGDLEFELAHDDSLRRSHCGRTQVVEESPQNVAQGRQPDRIEWWLSVEEYLDGSHGPVQISVESAGFPQLSPDQARKVARGLLDAAEIAEARNVKPVVSLDAHAPQYREADEKFDPERDQ